MCIRLLRLYFRAFRIVFLAPLLAVSPFCAVASGKPVSEEPQLVVTFDADLHPDFAERRLGFTALSALPNTEYRTATVWTDGVAAFSGVLLWDLLRDVGMDPATWQGSMTFHAIDGYVARIESAIVTPQAPLLALRKNGRPMSRRRHGPFWVIFPYDDDPSFRTETVLSLSIWQVERVSIAP